MAKKARIVHQNSQPIDFAPGVDNIVLRRNGVEFYNTETFHSSPFYTRTVPLLIKDIIMSNNLIEIYGINGLRAQDMGVVLVNNHPIRKIRIVGRITEYFIRELRNEEVYFVTLDDSSGSDLIVKVSSSRFLGAGIQPSNCIFTLIELTGLCSYYNDKLEFHPDFIQLLTNTDKYIDEEVQFWEKALEMRELLQTPWYQTPQINNDENFEARLEAKAYREKLIRQRLDIGAEDCPSQAMVLDSQIYTRNTRDRDDYSHALNSGSESEEEPEIEEITKQVFKKSIEKKLSNPTLSIAKSHHKWVNISSIPFKTFPLETSLKFELIKWMIKNSQEKFNLNEPFKNRKISSVLKEIASKKSHKPIEIDVDLSQMPTLNDIKGVIFHNGRHDLQVWNLIKCTRSKECFCAPILRFYKHLTTSLEKIKFLSSQGSDNTSLISSEYIQNFNNESGLKIRMDLELLNILIQWTILKHDDKDWKFNLNTKEWQFISTIKRRRLVP